MNSSNQGPSPSWWERITYSPWLAILYERRRHVIIAIIIILLVISATVLFFQKRATQQVADYEDALSYAEQLQMGPRLFSPTEESTSNLSDLRERNELLEKLITLAKKNPIIADHFHGLIANELMIAGKIAEVQPYIDAAIDESEHFGLLLYAQFSQSSVFLQQNQFQQAEELILQMLTNPAIERQPILYAFTLLQQVLIEQRLGKYNDALQTIERLKTFVERGESEPQSPSQFVAPQHDLELFESHLQDHRISLLDFLAQNNK